MNKNFKVNYLARDFSSIKDELTKYAKRYYSNELADLSEASINSFLIESVAYVGDVLSYYLDFQVNESFLATAIEYKNILSLAKSMGYKQRDTASAMGKVAVYILLPNDGTNKPDYKKAPVIKKGTLLNSGDSISYVTTEDLRFSQEVVGTNYVVARVNELGAPQYYVVKTYVPIISGRIFSTTIEIGNFSKFRKVYLSNPRTAEIVSAFDSDGNQYYEVPNLSQNIIYKAFLNSDTVPKYILKTVSAQRRFVFDYDSTLPYLLFGSSRYKEDDNLTIDPVTEPTKFALNRYNNDFLQDEYFEPNKLLNGDSYGIAPENTILTINYRANTSNNNNSKINSITKIENLLYSFEDPYIDTNTANTIIASIQVTNEEEIVGQSNSLSGDDIKKLASDIYAAQNRAVTAKDYETLCYMMPNKYGSVKRVKADRDASSLKNNINLYVVCEDEFQTLLKANTTIKENIKTWLSNYKILTDTVDILDAKIINLGINYTVVVDPSENKSEVLSTVQERLKNFYFMKPQIGESFNLLDLYREIRKVPQVLDIKDVKIKNINGLNYSTISFNIKENTSSDGNFIKIPKNAIYEIKFLDTDIIGNAI